MPIIYPTHQLKKFEQELIRRRKQRTGIWSAIQSIPKKREDLKRALANLEADEKFETGRQEDNEKHIRFLERTLIESTDISSKADALRRMKEKVVKLEREIIEVERETRSR